MQFLLCILDMRPDVHYTLERLPAIKKALIDADVVYRDIYKFENEFGKYDGPGVINQDFINFVKNNNITTIFTSSEWLQFVSIETLFQLRKNGVLLSSVLGDDENNYHININYLGIIDVPVAYRQKEHKKYLTFNQNTLSMSISVSLYNSNRYLNLNKEYDVIFIGRAYGKRPELLQHLVNNNINIIIYGGDRWKKYFDDSVYKGYIENLNYYNEIAKSKITLALLESPLDVNKMHVNAKPFDAAKTGVALISTRFKDFFQDYKLQEGIDLLAYSSKQELLLSVKNLLNNDKLRDSVSVSFRNKIKERYDYDILYKSLFSKIFNIKKSKLKINQANVLFIENFIIPNSEIIQDYDYVIFKKKGVVYSEAIRNVLLAHVGSNKFVKLDSFYKGNIARKIFSFIDIASLAIPVKLLHTLNKSKGIVRIADNRAVQAYICLNHYTNFSLYIIGLVVIRLIYKRFFSAK